MEDEDVDGQAKDAGTVDTEDKSPNVEKTAPPSRVSTTVPSSPDADDTLKRTSKVLSDPGSSPRPDDNETPFDDNRDDRTSSDASEDSPEKFIVDGATSKIIFKGFKKRILAQTQENDDNDDAHDEDNETIAEPSTVDVTDGEKKSTDGKRGKITEYAQYLGLQPAATNNKSKCAKCSNPSTNSCAQTMTKPHQCTCAPSASGITDSAQTQTTQTTTSSSPRATSPQSSTPSSANNFRITRKVYLCAACGTYFENWNLFLHMRDTHKRHICLFCLGMFGQAERLSYHLAKKHSVPETTFTSVEDFHNVFKDSCYLICCTCEKVFTETDNFYNHYCSPVQKSRNSSSCTDVCSVCRQQNGHTNTCTSHVDGRENTAVSSGLPGIPGTTESTAKSIENPIRNKRTLKNNRLKRTGQTQLKFYHKKLSEMFARKMKMKSRKLIASDNEGDSTTTTTMVKQSSSEIFTTMTTTTTTTTAPSTTSEPSKIEPPTKNEIPESPRDTVSETIMEVSKCTDNSIDDALSKNPTDSTIQMENTEPSKISSSPCVTTLGSPSGSSSPRRRLSDGSLYDSVAETIMEVSRCSDVSRANSSANEDDEDDEDEEDDEEIPKNQNPSNPSQSYNLIANDSANLRNDVDSPNGKENYDDRLKPTRQTATTLDPSDTEDDCSSNRSDRQTPTRLNTTNETETSPEKSSHPTSVSFTTVNTTDRSLVIKICTNRNSQFSVTSANGRNYENNHETSRESEENNNDDDSGSDKRSAISANSCRVDDDDDEDDEEEDDEEPSDSDVGKLSVVDVEKCDDDEQAEERENVKILTTRTKNNTDGDLEDRGIEERIVDEAAIDVNDESTIKIVCNDSDVVEESTIKINDEKPSPPSDGIILAPEDVPIIDLNVDNLLETMKIDDILKRCIKAASNCCIYCNHARHIAVNGKQLSLHVLAEHRFQPQHPAIVIHREQFVRVIKKFINDLSANYFNLESFDTSRGTYNVQIPRVYECFHCRYHSYVHKDVYLHNRKMHQKTILICVMCKSTFYSYSELLCHLCPGVYTPNFDVRYRCCLCVASDFPSAFRLMVHLRKRHHSCDVCLESTGNQQRLSNHVWKHKLHHLCYRCGIAYRNKPDITKHLFWKHGTESVLCKKCLQKKWPHVYHFCIPPTAFVCEECTGSFSRAVALKVHKRLHTGDRPYGCDDCGERFISKKLLFKHETTHREPVKTVKIAQVEKIVERTVEETIEEEKKTATTMKIVETIDNDVIRREELPKEIPKKVVDVYDLPPLNLSSDSDSDVEIANSITTTKTDNVVQNVEATKMDDSELINDNDNSKTIPSIVSNFEANDAITDPEINEEVKKEEAQIMDGIWHNFKSYAASLEKPLITESKLTNEAHEERLKYLCELIIADHDYCVIYGDKGDVTDTKEDVKMDDGSTTMAGEHDYGHKLAKISSDNESPRPHCDSDTNTTTTIVAQTTAKKKKEQTKTPKKRKQNGGGSTSESDSSSDSDSSSCSCGTNCSCTSSSSGSSSSSSTSSDSESSGSEVTPKKLSARKERRRDKDKEIVVANDDESEAKDAKMEITETIVDDDAKITKIVENDDFTNVDDNSPVREHPDEDNHNVEVDESPNNTIFVPRESDLDTDETETDEDFYDEHPQKLANKLLAEKRNQLMLLAAVAPVSTDATSTNISVATNIPKNFNNGAIDVKTTNSAIIEKTTTIIDDVVKRGTNNPRGQNRKRVKTKKRKKTDKTKTNKLSSQTVESIKLNIPKCFYEKNKNYGGGTSTTAMITVLPSRSSTPNLQNSQIETTTTTTTPVAEMRTNNVRLSVGGSGSENDNKRSSKRKRVPKRFYGDSSDDETDRHQQIHHQQIFQQQLHHQQQQQLSQQQSQQLSQQQSHHNLSNPKWRKIDNPDLSINSKTMKTTTTNPTKNVTLRLSGFDKPLERIVSMNVAASESEEPAESSSGESTEAEENSVAVCQPAQQVNAVQQQQTIVTNIPAAVVVDSATTTTTTTTSMTLGPPERSVNLYCYCQCPYDEVSEMIACDGDDCRIEWFHFECVGIMVPPKGKWYCPDCRKKDDSQRGNEEQTFE